MRSESILLNVGNFLIVKDDLQPADLIHVLGGRKARSDFAIQLYWHGYAQKILFTGKKTAPIYTEYAIHRGVPPIDLFPVASKAKNTYEEAVEVKHFLGSSGSISSIIIVTSPYHLRRVQWTFKKVLGDQVSIQFASVPFEQSCDEYRWWTNNESRKMVLKEYLKLLFYQIRYLI